MFSRKPPFLWRGASAEEPKDGRAEREDVFCNDSRQLLDRQVYAHNVNSGRTAGQRAEDQLPGLRCSSWRKNIA